MGPGTIAAMHENDWPAVREIYAEGIATGDATFETAAPEWMEWDATHLRSCRLTVREGANIVGWAALSPVSRRTAYAGVAEVSVYVAAAQRRRGWGGRLLAALVEESEKQVIWMLQAAIFPENGASIRLHERAGFRVVGVRERIARQDGRWRDTLLMERRSQAVGL